MAMRISPLRSPPFSTTSSSSSRILSSSSALHFAAVTPTFDEVVYLVKRFPHGHEKLAVCEGIDQIPMKATDKSIYQLFSKASEAPKPSSGPHKSRECLPLILILRDKLKYALTFREVVAILMQRHVLVDGKDCGPQMPTDVTSLLKCGTNLLQAVGQFNGNYSILVTFMSVKSPASPMIADYVQDDVATQDLDSDIVEGPSRISLNCPISVVQEVLKIQLVQHLLEPVLEPLIRRVVREEVELALRKHLNNLKRAAGKEVYSPKSRNLQLQFLNTLSLPVFTGARIEGEDSLPIKVALVDALTGQIVNSGPEASTRIEIIVLEGDFDSDEGDNWTLEEFKNNIVREREGKKPLLTGDAFLTLKLMENYFYLS